MRKLLNGFILFFIFTSITYASGIDDIALKRGIGVRAAGMGGAFTAIADDGSAVFYNPAGLAEPGLAYSYGDPDSDEKNIIGTFQLLKLGYLGYGSWDLKNQAGDEISETALAFGNRSGWMNWGLNYKSLSWTVGGVKGDGWSNDFGFLVRVTPHIKVGLLAQDVLTSKSFIASSSGRLGIAIQPFDGKFKMASDLEFSNARSYGHVGLEATIVKGVSLRGGLDRSEPTLGFAFDLPFFSFNYAALFSGNGQTTHRFEAGTWILPKKERPFSIIRPKEYALINIGGALRGGRDEISLFGGLHPGLDTLLSQIRKAGKDSSIDGIMLRIEGFSGGLGGMAMVQELRAELERAREKGKKIIAFLEGGAMGDEYYLASIADKIVAPPGSAIGGFGKSIEIYRYGGLYKKLGIEWQIISKGKYKDIFNPYTTQRLNQEQAKVVRALVADLYRQMLTDIAASRKLPIEKVKEIGDAMLFPAGLAKAMGLVDEIGYFKDAKRIAAEILGETKSEALMVEPKQVVPEEVLLSSLFPVAVIEVDGEIVSGKGGENLIFGGRRVGSDTIVDYIQKAADDMSVKAIILRINSPGGDAVAAGEIYRVIQYAKEKKKVVASIGNMGASGGYYIAAAADKIVADRASLTGSIGVLTSPFPVFSELLGKIDSTAEVFKEGAHADMFSGLRKMTSVEVMAIQRLLNEAYNDFVTAVANGRNLPTAEVEKLAQGQIFTGAQALDNKLIDKVGGFFEAVEVAKAEAKIGGEPKLIFYHEASPFFPFGEGIVESLGLREISFWDYPGWLLQRSMQDWTLPGYN